MQQYDIDFFDRDLIFVHRDFVNDIRVDEDYLSLTQNSVEIGGTTAVKNGHFIRIVGNGVKFFGVVSDCNPGQYKTTVFFKPFLSLFDENICFDTNAQNKTVDRVVDGVTEKINAKSLENVIKDYITSEYINASDTLQNLNITVSVVTDTRPWGLNITSDVEGSHYALIGLYGVLISRAMKQYGIALNIEPDFQRKKVGIVISTQDQMLSIDGNLDSVTVKTLKMNDRPDGINKLTVIDTTDFTRRITFYVYTDRTWGIDDKNRITPVVKEYALATPDETIADPITAFGSAALDVGYSKLSGLTWDNLIELELIPSDPNINAVDMKFGQPIALWYKGARYISILTGRMLNSGTITLSFGSERIHYSKRRSS